MLQGENQSITYTVENTTAKAMTIELMDDCDATFTFNQSSVTVYCAPHSTASIDITGRAHERGDLCFRRIFARVHAGHAFLEARFAELSQAQIRVYPNFLQRDDASALTQRTVLLREGSRRLQRQGSHGERNGLRAYRAGDPFRSIDFKATARRGTLTVAEYGAERGEQIVLAIDCGRLMTGRADEKSMLDHAVGAALSIGIIARDAGDRIGMHAFARQSVITIAPRAGSGQSAVLADAAAALQARFEESDYERAAAEILHRFRKRSLIVLFTSLLDPASSQPLAMACERLSRRHAVVCVVINDGLLQNIAAQEILTPEDADASATAMRLLDERRTVLHRLRAGRTIMIDAPAAELTMPLLDAYLRVKRGFSA